MAKRKKQTTRDSRFAVVVLGMHRSGTSALAGLLTRLGCEGPRDLITAAPMNAKGFYESNAISYFDEDLMESAGSSWYTWQAFNQEWFHSPKVEEFREHALEHLASVYPAARMPVLKDPRMCLLVPFWDDVLNKAGFDPRYVLTHRHPLEVAQSLNHWAGYDNTYGQLLWLRYALEAEFSTREKKRVFTSYAAVLQDWLPEARRMAKSLDLVWPSNSDKVTAEIDTFLDNSLRHMDAGAAQRMAGLRLSPWVAETFEILNGWVAAGETSADWATLDEIRLRFDEATPTFSASVEAGRRDSLALQSASAQMNATQAHLRQVEDASAKSLQAVEVARTEAAQVSERAAALEQDLEAARTRHSELAAALHARTQEGAQLRKTIEDERAQAAERAAALEQDLEAARTRHSELEAAHQTLSSERGALMRETRIARERDEHARREELARTVSAIREAADAAIEDLETQIRQAAESAKAERIEAAERTTTLKHALEQAMKDRDALQSLLSDREKASEDLKHRIAMLESELAQRRAEIDDLNTSLHTSLRKLADDAGDLTHALTASQGEVRDLGGRLAASNARIEILMQDLHEARSAHQTLASERAAFMRETRIARERDEHARREELARTVSAIREAADARIEDLETQLRQAIEKANAEGLALRNEQEQIQRHLQEAQQRINDLLGSTSWRITGPLRWSAIALRAGK